MVKNVIRLSRRAISTLLCVLLLLSTLVVGSVTASAEDNGVFIPNAKNSSTNSKVYFLRPNSNWVASRVHILLYTDSKVFSDKIGKTGSIISNTSLNYRSAYSIASDLSSTTFDWQDVKAIAFVCLKSNAEHTTAFEKGDVTALLTNGVGDLALTDDMSACTKKLSPNIEDGDNVKYHYFYPTDSEASPAIALSTFNSLSSPAQTVGVTYGSSGSVTTSQYRFLSGVSSASDSTVSTINGEATVDFSPVFGSSITLTANGNEFDGWYTTPDYSDTCVSINPTLTYTVNGNNAYYAKFSNGVGQSAYAGEGGTAIITVGNSTVTSIGVVPNTDVTFTAMPDANYKFDGWYNNSAFTGDAVSLEDPYVIEATSNNTLYAKFSSLSGGEGSDLDVSDKNKDSRHKNATALSPQAKSYYQDELSNIVVYRDTASEETQPVEEATESAEEATESAEEVEETGAHTFSEGSAGVYQTFKDYGSRETNPADSSYTVAQNNTLYTALYNIMSTTHTHGVSYPAYGSNSLANYWLYTDTSSDNGDKGVDVYTMFYSDVDCYSHIDMQREHIWPKSKASFYMATGLGGSDLHHLRPAYKTVNNIKSNWGFADIKTESENGYTINNSKTTWSKLRTVEYPSNQTSLWRAVDSNGETFVDVKDDVRGDIARILLYVYTRWKQPNLYTDILDSDGNRDTSKIPDSYLDKDDDKDTGERIIYDLDTLLKWMKEDPVSEWEMTRNDLTEDVQGNRNVFIDYPELAWLLFDQPVPNDMVTPSGRAKNIGADIEKTVDTRTYTDKITMDFSSVSGNGVAEIKAFNNTTQKYVRDGDKADRGDIITYTIIPNESTITNIREFKSNKNSGAGLVNSIATPNTDSQYSFTRRAGYFDGSPNVAEQDEESYKKERIKVTLDTKVCEVNFKISSVTATTHNPGGSGSGMVTARYASGDNKNKMIGNGDTVPNDTPVILTFTPDYGSRFYGLTLNNAAQTPTPILGTDTYTFTTTLSPTSSTRTKTFNVKFAQTFNANTKDEGSTIDKHIYNKGMRPEADDPIAELTDFTENFEICGVQIKPDEQNPENKALRFISVIDSKILAKANSYGYVIGYTNRTFTDEDGKTDYKPVNRNAYTLVMGNDEYGVTIPCTETDNSFAGDYGKRDTDKKYKYITASVNNLQDADALGVTIIARPYVELKPEYVGEDSPSVIYGQYVDVATGEEFCACSGSYNYIASLSN